MSMIFQEPSRALNPLLTVGEQIGELFAAHGGLSRRERWERAIELLRSVGIRDPRSRYREYPHEFSGGMQQRILIAMAVALRPSLIVADEPTTALDATVQVRILELLKRLQEETGASILLITHDLRVVALAVGLRAHPQVEVRGADAQVLEEDVGEHGVVVLMIEMEERRVGKECRSRWSPYH